MSSNTPPPVTIRNPATTAAAPSPRLLVGTLSFVSLVVALLQTAVIPVLGAIAKQLHEPSVSVSWVVTANLLAAAEMCGGTQSVIDYTLAYIEEKFGSIETYLDSIGFDAEKRAKLKAALTE